MPTLFNITITQSGKAVVDLKDDSAVDQLILNADSTTFVDDGSTLTYTSVSNFDTSEDKLGVFYGSNTAYSSGLKSTSKLLSGITAISQDRIMLEQDATNPLTSTASPSYDTIDEIQSKLLILLLSFQELQINFGCRTCL